MMAPVEAVEKLLSKTGWDRDKDVDLIELNEAFAVAAIAVTRAASPESRKSKRERRRGCHRASHRRVAERASWSLCFTKCSAAI